MTIAAIEPHSSLLVAMGCAVLVYAEASGSIAGDRRHPLSGRPRLGASGWPASAIMSGFWRGSQKTLEPQSEHECRLLS